MSSVNPLNPEQGPAPRSNGSGAFSFSEFFETGNSLNGTSPSDSLTGLRNVKPSDSQSNGAHGLSEDSSNGSTAQIYTFGRFDLRKVVLEINSIVYVPDAISGLLAMALETEKAEKTLGISSESAKQALEILDFHRDLEFSELLSEFDRFIRERSELDPSTKFGVSVKKLTKKMAKNLNEGKLEATFDVRPSEGAKELLNSFIERPLPFTILSDFPRTITECFLRLANLHETVRDKKNILTTSFIEDKTEQKSSASLPGISPNLQKLIDYELQQIKKETVAGFASNPTDALTMLRSDKIGHVVVRANDCTGFDLNDFRDFASRVSFVSDLSALLRLPR